MGLLGTLFSKIFPSSHAANRNATAQQPGIPNQASQQTATQPGTSQMSAPASATTGQAAANQAAAATVDVEQVLNDMASKNSQKLNWRTSIVDLMKLVGMDSSLDARKELAKELNYTGDTSDSAAMNIWLHKQVMKRIAENGGKVPQDLLH